MSNKYERRTWKKIFELGNNGNAVDEAYAQILATAVDLRLKSGLTQTDIAKKSGLSTSMVSKIEAQFSVPTIKNFLRYISALDLDWEFVRRQ